MTILDKMCRKSSKTQGKSHPYSSIWEIMAEEHFRQQSMWAPSFSVKIVSSLLWKGKVHTHVSNGAEDMENTSLYPREWSDCFCGRDSCLRSPYTPLSTYLGFTNLWKGCCAGALPALKWRAGKDHHSSLEDSIRRPAR